MAGTVSLKLGKGTHLIDQSLQIVPYYIRIQKFQFQFRIGKISHKQSFGSVLFYKNQIYILDTSFFPSEE